MKKSESKVEIYHRVNRLRLKAGFGLNEEAAGFIDQEAIERAQNHIDEKEKEYPVEVNDLLDKIQKAWNALKESGGADREEHLAVIHNHSSHIKDLTATYQHNLMHDFALSLRNFCEDIDVNKPEHHIIVQAHLDVMWVTYNEKLKEGDSEKAKELRAIVKKAIEKYS